MPSPLSLDEVRRIASLARLDISDERAEQLRTDLGAILTYAQRLAALDLKGVEPMTTPLNTTGPLAEDTPGPTLPTADALALAPQTFDTFIQVPKVLPDAH